MSAFKESASAIDLPSQRRGKAITWRELQITPRLQVWYRNGPHFPSHWLQWLRPFLLRSGDDIMENLDESQRAMQSPSLNFYHTQQAYLTAELQEMCIDMFEWTLGYLWLLEIRDSDITWTLHLQYQALITKRHPFKYVLSRWQRNMSSQIHFFRKMSQKLEVKFQTCSTFMIKFLDIYLMKYFKPQVKLGGFCVHFRLSPPCQCVQFSKTNTTYDSSCLVAVDRPNKDISAEREGVSEVGRVEERL